MQMILNKGIKNINISIAIFCAMFFCVSSLYFAAYLFPIFMEVVDLVNKESPIGINGLRTIILLGGCGIFTYFLSVFFVAFHRRILDYLYEGAIKSPDKKSL